MKDDKVSWMMERTLFLLILHHFDSLTKKQHGMEYDLYLHCTTDILCNPILCRGQVQNCCLRPVHFSAKITGNHILLR
jgi:hypothetical protein